MTDFVRCKFQSNKKTWYFYTVKKKSMKNYWFSTGIHKSFSEKLFFIGNFRLEIQ